MKIEKRAKLIYYAKQICDSCDKKSNCAHIQLGITNFVWIICKECLSEFLYGDLSENEIRKIKLKQIKYAE